MFCLCFIHLEVRKKKDIASTATWRERFPYVTKSTMIVQTVLK